jgi:hypothetical protein
MCSAESRPRTAIAARQIHFSRCQKTLHSAGYLRGGARNAILEGSFTDDPSLEAQIEVNSLGTVSEHYGGRPHVASNLPIQESSLRWISFEPWMESLG